MLARKYYAQRGTSKGGNMNTRAVAASSSAVMRKRKLYGNQIVVKNVQDRSSSEKITFVKTLLNWRYPNVNYSCLIFRNQFS